MIVFLHPSAAAAFMTFTNTQVGRSRFPGNEINHLGWSRGIPKPDPDTVLRAASDPVNPARRVLVFRNYTPISITMNTKSIENGFKMLEKRFAVDFSVDDYKYNPQKSEAIIVFNMISAAMSIMQLYKTGNLRWGFDHCDVIFGIDPSDTPIPRFTKPTGTGTIPPFPRILDIQLT